jgi:hypothetical protein
VCAITVIAFGELVKGVAKTGENVLEVPWGSILPPQRCDLGQCDVAKYFDVGSAKMSVHEIRFVDPVSLAWAFPRISFLKIVEGFSWVACYLREIHHCYTLGCVQTVGNAYVCETTPEWEV